MRNRNGRSSGDLELERLSSATTLSDLELLVFPELLFGLVLADIMSPRLWRWRQDPWFAGVTSMSPHRRILRVRQYIMDHYAFNLDLDTWGLTTRKREQERFRDFMERRELAQLSPFFGCEGAEYYFEQDIRSQFGLDRHGADAIPYWKTETLEAMDAFKHINGSDKGAGECVSLAALYAAALFVVARIPLDRIYLMLTPLHCQCFVDVGDGILTNNRRIVTKRCWFNGTKLAQRARRALTNERVVLVAHESGWVLDNGSATMDEASYQRFARRLRSFTQTRLTPAVFLGFLRQRPDLQARFRVRCRHGGKDIFVPLTRLFACEGSRDFWFSAKAPAGLVDAAVRNTDTHHSGTTPCQLVLNDALLALRDRPLDLESGADQSSLRTHLHGLSAVDSIVVAVAKYCQTRPSLPASTTSCPATVSLGLTPSMERRQLVQRLREIRHENRIAEVAFYSYRDLTNCESRPFLKAAIERNPVSIEKARELSVEEVMERVANMPEESIYPESGRLALPDEVWNYGRGDGLEKALLLANILRSRLPSGPTSMRTDGGDLAGMTEEARGQERW